MANLSSILTCDSRLSFVRKLSVDKCIFKEITEKN